MNSAPLVIVGMSGGVDSSVAAWQLLSQGYQVQGLFMSNWDEDEDGYCTAAEDFADARRVCETLSIPLHKISFAGEYRERVFEYFLTEYRAGRTPNPDVLCNREIKFGVCFDHARRLGADYVATGHYARVAHEVTPRLLKGLDPAKDQSYFLNSMPATALARTLFPIGEMRKPEVRRLAQQLGLPVFDKKDSTGICFIGERPFAAFLAKYLPAQPGDIETPDGSHIGRHNGLMYYTLGQRQGLGIGGRATASDEPWYVAAKDLERNVLIVVQGHDHPRLQTDSLRAVQLSWIAGVPPCASFPADQGAVVTGTFRCVAKVRYRQEDRPCEVTTQPDGTCEVHFDEPQRAVTPGQYVVFYLADECLGGGVIESARLKVSRELEAGCQPVRATM